MLVVKILYFHSWQFKRWFLIISLVAYQLALGAGVIYLLVDVIDFHKSTETNFETVDVTINTLSESLDQEILSLKNENKKLLEKIDSLAIENLEADERIVNLEHETEFQLDELNKIIVSLWMYYCENSQWSFSKVKTTE